MSDKKFPFPGIETTTDGSGAVVWVETNIDNGSCAYPITPSTNMGGGFQAEVANGKRNLWGEHLAFVQPESEHSAASTCEGFALAGGRVTNFTSGQGLVLMKEVLYTIAGKRLPVVFHIGARALTSHSLNVHCGHDDVMSVADVGWGIIFSRTAQDAGDMALISRRVAEDTRTPFMAVQDGFLTTHTIEKIRLCEPELMKQFVGNPSEKVINMFDTKNPLQTGVVQNQDSYMKGKIAQRYFYDLIPAAIDHAFEEFYNHTGRKYSQVETYRMEDAEYAVIGLGGLTETCETAVDWLRENKGMKVGVVSVRSFRPFPGDRVVQALKNVKAFTVIERMDNPLAQSNSLTAEIKSAFVDALNGFNGYHKVDKIPAIYSGSAGMGSRDIRAGDFISVYNNMVEKGKQYFVLGIIHPLALEMGIDPDVRPAGAFSMRGHSVGGFGSVTTNKIIATIGGEVFGMHVQAYPKYGSEKKGLPTTYYLTLGKEHIRSHSELELVDFVALNDVNAFNNGNPLHGLGNGGKLFVQSQGTTPEEVWSTIPAKARKVIRERKITVIALDTVAIAKEISTQAEFVQRMQGIVLLGIFLKQTPFKDQLKISDEDVFKGVEKAVRKYFGKRGEQVVADNMNCVKRGYSDAFVLPASVIESEPKAVMA